MALSTKSPLDGHELDPIEATPAERVAEIVASAKKAQEAWAATPIKTRIRTVAKIKARILDRAEAIAKTLHDEIGKPEVEAMLAEVLPSADVVDYWCTS